MYFLEPRILSELLFLADSTGESVAFLQCVHQACRAASSMCGAESETVCRSLLDWFGGAEFVKCIAVGRNRLACVSMDAANRSFSSSSGLSDSAFGPVSCADVLHGVAAMLRLALRHVAPVSYMRLDESFLWEARYVPVDAKIAEEIAGSNPGSEVLELVGAKRWGDAAAVIEEGPSFPRKEVLLICLKADALIVPFREALIFDPPLPGSSESQFQETLLKGLALLEKALVILEQDECVDHSKPEDIDCNPAANRQTIASQIKGNCSVLYLWLRDCRKALSLMDEGTADTIQSNLIVNRCLVLLYLGRLPEVMQQARKVEGQDSDLAARLLAQACFVSGDLSQAEALLWQVVHSDGSEIVKLRSLQRLLELYGILQNSEKEKECFESIRIRFPSEPEAWFALACDQWRRGVPDDPLMILERAYESGLPNLKLWISWQMGRILFETGKHLSACDHYSKIASREKDSIQAREFAVSLSRAGLEQASFSWAQSLRQVNGKVVPQVTEIEINCLLENNRLDEALELLECIERSGSMSGSTRLAMAKVQHNLGFTEAARNTIAFLEDRMLPPDLSRKVADFIVEVCGKPELS